TACRTLDRPSRWNNSRPYAVRGIAKIDNLLPMRAPQVVECTTSPSNPPSKYGFRVWQSRSPLYRWF
ncbi:MAG: hypothetical protein ACRD3O_12170, partial [Terriglobia bacterium]